MGRSIKSKKPKPRLSARSPAEKNRREILLRLVAPYALAAVELGWFPPGFVGPGVRLEYLRQLNGHDTEEWPKSAGMKQTQYQNWRSTRTMPDGFLEKGAAARQAICRLLATLRQNVEFAWVLGGSGLNQPGQKEEHRADMLIAIAKGMRKTNAQSAEELDSSLWDKATDSTAFRAKVPTPIRLAAINALARISSRWSTQQWLETGVAKPPASISELANRLESEIPSYLKSHWWRAKKHEEVEVTMTRVQALMLAHMVEHGVPIPAEMGPILLRQLQTAEVVGLTPQGRTLGPLSVDAFIRIAPGLLRTLCMQLGERFIPALPGDDLPNQCQRWIATTHNSASSQ